MTNQELTQALKRMMDEGLLDDQGQLTQRAKTLILTGNSPQSDSRQLSFDFEDEGRA